MKLMRLLLPVTSWTHFVPSDAKRNMDLLAPFVWSSALNPSFTKATGAPNHVCLHTLTVAFGLLCLLDLVDGVGTSSFGSEYYVSNAKAYLVFKEGTMRISYWHQVESFAGVDDCVEINTY